MELARIEQAVIDERERDATVERAQKALLANLRHELRTPINAITNYAEMLLEDVTAPGALPAVEAALRPDLERIRRAGQELLALVNDILNPSYLEAGELELEACGARLRHELLTPINTVIGYSELLSEEAAACGQESLLPDLERIHSAAGRFLALLNELVSFALNFEEIEAGELAPHFSGGAQTKMVQEVVTAIRSLAEREAEQAPAGSGPVLVVDDNELNRDVLARRLERQGHQVKVAANGRQALEMVRAGQFDLVLLDIMMPELNGYQVLQQLKADAALRDIPVIMISALDELDSVVRCLESGAEDYLPKPFEPVILRARVSACLEKKRLRNQEIEYLKNVACLTTAAAAVEAGTFAPESLAETARRADELGRLARVFERMAREVYAREQRLKQQVQQLRIEIDEAKRARQVAEIVETDYFQQLQQRARGLRNKQC
jgi:DNA-binding response OmpR family regulator